MTDVPQAANDGSLKLAAWEEQLPATDPKREFLLTGIADGFHIVDQPPIHRVEVENHKSAVSQLNRDKVEDQIIDELNNQQYKIVHNKPHIVSALGAIPKKGSEKVRLLHDASRPAGDALNDYAHPEHFQYQTIDDAMKLIKPGAYMAKIDLSNAYRVVRVHPSDWEYTGLKWTFRGHDKPTFMVDTRLSFGARKSPMIFNELTQAVRRIMAAKGFHNIVVYLDDFLVVEDSYESCKATMDVLRRVLRELGFRINYKKIEGPTQRINFLGVILDSNTMSVDLPASKCAELKETLSATMNKTKVTKKQLQSLAGKLNWASLCIYGGRFHLRRILDRMNCLQRPHHRTRVTCDMRADITWWLRFMDMFNGTVPMVDYRPVAPVSIDACSEAAGAFFLDSFIYTPWASAGESVQSLHINHKEVMALEPAAHCWAPLWANKLVHVHSDNQAAVAIINKGSCKNPIAMESLRRVFWLSAIYNFRLKAFYYPGCRNILADSASRLHESGSWDRLLTSMAVIPAVPAVC